MAASEALFILEKIQFFNVTFEIYKDSLKKGIKSLGGLAGGTGFVNPLLAASKYSPADKAMEMVEKAMDQALSEDK